MQGDSLPEICNSVIFYYFLPFLYFLFERKNGILILNERTVTHLMPGIKVSKGKNPPEEEEERSKIH